MKKNKKLLQVLTVIALLGVGILLSGCSKDDATAENNNVKTLKVSVPTGYKPYGYLDEDGDFKGYEVEVLKQIDKLIPEYQFEYVQSAAPLTDVKTGKTDIAASQFYKTDEREKSYTLTDEPYTNYGTYIAFDGDKNETYNSLDDLKGKTVVGYPQGAEIYAVEKWNEENNDGIKINYLKSTGDTTVQLKQLQNGTSDAVIAQDYTADYWNKEFNTNIKTSDKPIFTGGTYYILKKGNTEVKEKLDKAVKTLKENGELSKISKEILGADYTQPIE